MIVEVVRGMGETLVGNYPGAALRFTADKRVLARATVEGSGADLRVSGLPDGAIKLAAFPSKSTALLLPEERTSDGKILPVLIFRSDSNGEDLEG